MKRVVVIGGGAAGTGAALAAARGGAQVTLLDGGSGASTLAPGALDLHPWPDPKSGVLDEAALSVLSTLDVFSVEPALLASTGGIVRPAGGADRSLLDLAKLSPGLVAVPRSDHAGWDAHALSRAWSAAPRAQERGLSFSPIDAQITRMADERHIADADIATRHDEPERVDWLAERLRDALARASIGVVRAVILPPWLGVERPRAAALSAKLGLPCGEAMGLPGGPAGLRFERARDRALATVRASVARTRAAAVMRNGAGWKVALEQGEPLSADAVVLAAGGLVGGGLAYTPSHALLAGPLPPRPSASFALAIDAPARVGLRGEEPTIPGSIYGEPPEALAWPFAPSAAMDRVGVLTSDRGRVPGQDGLFGAGEIVADLPRTWLASFASGVCAGRELYAPDLRAVVR